MTLPRMSFLSQAPLFFAAGLLFGFGCATHSSSTSEASPGPPVAPTTPALAPSSATTPTPWLFDGKSLAGWAITDFGGHGDVKVENGQIFLGMGAALTGINWSNATLLPKSDYEISLDAMKIDGSDFFCGLTFPVSDSYCTLIVGGWGGGVVGISSIDSQDASENETTKSYNFDKNRWFHIRARVTRAKIEAWIDADKVADVELAEKKISMRPGEIESSVPLGVATYQTTAAIKNIDLKKISK